MKDQKDKQCRFIFYSQFGSYLPGVPLILTMSVLYILPPTYTLSKTHNSALSQCGERTKKRKLVTEIYSSVT